MSSARSSRANEKAVKAGRGFWVTLATNVIRVSAAGKRFSGSERLLVILATRHQLGKLRLDTLKEAEMVDHSFMERLLRAKTLVRKRSLALNQLKC
ncbi:hypothetical protein PGIGA_G00112350 [Pangasianodon gigas]|uniref:Uncharacterized protein n=1 Tax=Pangasianodon gigas TaxID=30993 RepID=A0ACC5W9G3_PANGG|nr:hypothetical protein [Pangasianodon gigas]